MLFVQLIIATFFSRFFRNLIEYSACYQLYNSQRLIFSRCTYQSRDCWVPTGNNMTCVDLLPQAKFEFKDSSIQPKYCLICCPVFANAWENFLLKNPKFLSATSNLPVEKTLVHLGRLMHFSQKVVGVTLNCSNLTIVFYPLGNFGKALCIRSCHEDLILTRKSHNCAGIAFIRGDSAGGSKLIEQTLQAT